MHDRIFLGIAHAEGIWSMCDAYDTLETTQILMLAQPDCP